MTIRCTDARRKGAHLTLPALSCFAEGNGFDSIQPGVHCPKSKLKGRPF